MLMLILILALASCGDNLVPDGNDKRPVAQPGTTGPGVSQNAPQFSVSDIDGNTVTLASALSGKSAVVLYFTMWCPICDTHMSHLRTSIVPSFPNVAVFLVDYVSGSVADARNAAVSSGYYGGGFNTLADNGSGLLQSYAATMGTTVVIDSSGVIKMSEDFKDGVKLQAVLSALP